MLNRFDRNFCVPVNEKQETDTSSRSGWRQLFTMKTLSTEIGMVCLLQMKMGTDASVRSLSDWLNAGFEKRPDVVGDR